MQPSKQAYSTDMALGGSGPVSLTDLQGAAVSKVACDNEDVCIICWGGAQTQGLVQVNKIHLCLCGLCVELYDYANLGCPMCRQIVKAVVMAPCL